MSNEIVNDPKKRKFLTAEDILSMAGDGEMPADEVHSEKVKMSLDEGVARGYIDGENAGMVRETMKNAHLLEQAINVSEFVEQNTSHLQLAKQTAEDGAALLRGHNAAIRLQDLEAAWQGEDLGEVIGINNSRLAEMEETLLGIGDDYLEQISNSCYALVEEPSSLDRLFFKQTYTRRNLVPVLKCVTPVSNAALGIAGAGMDSLVDSDLVAGIAQQALEGIGTSMVKSAGQIVAESLTNLVKEHEDSLNAFRQIYTGGDLEGVGLASSLVDAQYNALGEGIANKLLSHESANVEDAWHMPAFVDLMPKYEPPPKGGELLEQIKIYDGKVEQIYSVLSDEFGYRNSPYCYVRQNPDEKDYWVIRSFDGERMEAIKTVQEIESDDRRVKLEAQIAWSEKQIDIGYIHISNRPTIPIRFYIWDEKILDLVSGLARKLAGMLHEWGFEVSGDAKETGALPDGGREWCEWGVITVVETIDGLESQVKTYLQGNNQVPVSLSMQQVAVGSSQIDIRYNFYDCLIILQTKAIAPARTRLEPKILCWLESDIDFQKAINQAEAHVRALFDYLQKRIQWQPIKPVVTANMDDWFEYYFACENAGIKYSLKELANDCGLSYGYIRQKVSEYRAEKDT